jgi:hypothetical protein
LVLSHSPLKVEVVGTMVIRIMLFIVPSFLALVFDSILPSLSVAFKTQGERALPGRKKGAWVSPRAKPPQWYKVIGLSFFNICLGVAIQAGVELFFTEVLHIRSALRITTTLPMPWALAKDVATGLVLREVLLPSLSPVTISRAEKPKMLYLRTRDLWAHMMISADMRLKTQALQYYTHRYILHASRPNTLGNLHNAYFHSITAPFSFSSHFDHPLSYIFFRFLPVYLPAIMFRLHLLTYLLLLSIVTLEETIALSGYDTLPGIMLGGIARRQDLHSEGLGRGNYAPWGVLDWLHGSNIGPDLIDDVRNAAEKHQIKGRGEDSWESAKRGCKGSVEAWKGRRRSPRKG